MRAVRAEVCMVPTPRELRVRMGARGPRVGARGPRIGVRFNTNFDLTRWLAVYTTFMLHSYGSYESACGPRVGVHGTFIRELRERAVRA